MPVESTPTITVAPEPSSRPQSSFPFVLKKIMDIPPPNILEDCDDEKEKLCSASDGEGAVGAESGGLGGTGGVSASLTPAIWDKTIPYDGETFHLEYMDLDEFLLENGIPASMEEELQKNLGKESPEEEEKIPPATASSPTAAPTPRDAAPVSLLSSVELDEGEDDLTSSKASSASITKTIAEGSTEREGATPPPASPDEVVVEVNFQPDPADLVLSSVPGGELFNPRKHRFSEEELKPQPMIKKAKKVFVPSEQKVNGDDRYWERRKKNNVAAKRSRDARRLKENQITVRAAFLERENAALRQEVAELRKDCGRCKSLVSRYQAKYGPL
ncbi:TEF transcription factor, PAR bZIP family member b isoform X1 [Conger conger]|uniref:TEF transcription factor, PAR bZIP family member b isoform X1 n=1 Tax=Conger conger TaxID=82655 RepID=UPI002A5A8F15|nr:TEF transcription factor, PAR bZIP family member b isoform X1 [Conger conger]